MTKPNPFARLQRHFTSHGVQYTYYSLPALEDELPVAIHRMPICVRILLEAVLRNCDGQTITVDDVRNLAAWSAGSRDSYDVPFRVARILLQDFTGVPLLVDLAAMRSAVARLNRDPGVIEPLVPVDLVIDHSVQVDFAGVPLAFERNHEMEFKRNRERYQFLKWGQQAFNNFRVVPPAIGIVHQVNLEYLARGVIAQTAADGTRFAYPDTLVGTDSHTTMVNSLGVVGWGVGGIEAEAGMLGQPLYLLAPEVVGVHLRGKLRQAVTATDLALRITEMLRARKVVGKFVEFYGPGARSLSPADRAPIANMAPEYGATIGFFPTDQLAVNYFADTGRPLEQVSLVKDYFEAQQMFGMPDKGEIDYSIDLELDLDTIEPSVSGPKRPQDRVLLSDLKDRFNDLLVRPPSEGGYGKPAPQTTTPAAVRTPGRADGHDTVPGGGSQEPIDVTESKHKNTNPLTELEMANNRPTPDDCREGNCDESQAGDVVRLDHGSVVIAAITSCTNTSNPSLMMGAGILARNAVKRGLRVDKRVKASVAPGSRVVSHYLNETGLQAYLDQLGFNLVGYGCTTCIGNSGPLTTAIEDAIRQGDVVAAAVLSGNRNFEARIHQSIRANFLMSPPLVVAFALAGTVNIDLSRDPIGHDQDGRAVFLREIWPSHDEVLALLRQVLRPETYAELYSDVESKNPAWNEIPAPTGRLYRWDPDSTYIQEPPFFENFSLAPGTIEPLRGARALAILGDSVTTDHISPAGTIKKESPAGIYLQSKGVPAADFNSYGARRGNDRVMTRGTFANVRIRNFLASGAEGSYTRNLLSKEKEIIPIYDAAMLYKQNGIPLVIFGGKEYGTGSSRDWAAKGTRLLGVRAVIAESFERIHRSNLVGVGVLPAVFQEGTNAKTLNLDGSEVFALPGLNDSIRPRQTLELEIRRQNGSSETVPVTAMIDTPIEIEYYRHGGILQYVLRQLLSRS